MTRLRRNALARLAMDEPEVAKVYADNHDSKVVRDLCESHERLRAELQGAEVMLDELAALRELLVEAVAKVPAWAGADDAAHGWWVRARELLEGN